MANRTKHMQRSHRSYHNSKPFARFEAKAHVKTMRKEKRKTLGEMLKALFKRTTNK